MNEKILLISLLIIGFITFSCDKEELKFRDEFATSMETWLDFKEDTNNSYQYTVVFSSFSGFSQKTTISVENGIIIKRDYKLSFLYEVPASYTNEDLEWSETENEIGSHDDGAALLTLDEIYNKAKSDWLIEKKDARVIFETNNNGMISTSGYIDKNCLDDCFIGIRIQSIDPLFKLSS